MSRYNIFQAIYMSFYSRDLYRDVGANWGGKAFFYLLVLISLSWVGQTFIIQSNIDHLYAQGSEQIISQIPVIKIENGKLVTPENKPYVIKDPDGDGTVFAIVDTSGKYTELGSDDGVILVTKTQILTKPKPNETRIYQIPENMNTTIDPVLINGYIQNYISYAWIFVFIFLVFATFIYRIVQALFYAIIGKVFSLISGSDISYGKIIQIVMVAVTPAIILATVLDFSGIAFRHQNATYFIISMLYMFYGIMANKKSA
jgi:hypothetical protein